MRTVRTLHLLALVLAVLLMPLGRAQVVADSGSVYLSAEWGNSVGYELSGDTSWQHGADGILYGSDHISRANDGVNLFFQRGEQRWLFQFVAPQYNEATDTYDGQPLHNGLYDNVSGDWRYAPMNSGMLISSPLGMMWEWSGWFNVRDIAYAANGDLSRFAVDFMQYDTLNQSGPALKGALRYNSAIPIGEVPEPGTALLLLAALGAIGMLRRRAKA